jgi:hypothetical protein
LTPSRRSAPITGQGHTLLLITEFFSYIFYFRIFRFSGKEKGRQSATDDNKEELINQQPSGS